MSAKVVMKTADPRIVSQMLPLRMRSKEGASSCEVLYEEFSVLSTEANDDIQ